MLMLIAMSLYFILLVLKQVNVAAVVIIFLIHIQKYVFHIKDLNVKVFNVMSRTNETRNIKWHETCKCKYNKNNKQRWK